MLNSKTKTILASKKDIGRMKGARDYIGKDVISKSGDKIGKVHDIAVSGAVFEGLIVSRKTSKLLVDRKYIASSSGNSVMLSIDPVTMMLGKQVFDADGKKMGKVADIARKGAGNTFEALLVRKNFYLKPVKVPKSDISVSKKNIILKKVY